MVKGVHRHPFFAFPLCHAPFQPLPLLRRTSLRRCRAFTILIRGFDADFLPLVDVSGKAKEKAGEGDCRKRK